MFLGLKWEHRSVPCRLRRGQPETSDPAPSRIRNCAVIQTDMNDVQE